MEFYGNVTPSAQALSRSGNLRNRAEASIGSGSKITRSSARNVDTVFESPLGRGMAKAPTKPKVEKTGSSSTSVPRGVRVSRRLRDVEDEWQQIPEEWLSPDTAKKQEEQVLDDAESELSELTDEDVHEQMSKRSRVLRLRGGAGDDLTPAPESPANERASEQVINGDGAGAVSMEVDKTEVSFTASG